MPKIFPVYTCMHVGEQKHVFPVYACMHIEFPVYACMHIEFPVYACMYIEFPVCISNEQKHMQSKGRGCRPRLATLLSQNIKAHP